MNIAGDKENQPIKINGVNQEAPPCSSAVSTEANDKAGPHTTVNGNSLQNNDCNKLSFTNGAYPKVNPALCTSPSSNTCEASTSRIAQAPCSESTNLQNTNAGGESAQGVLPRNNPDCQEYENRHENAKKQCKPKVRQACNYDSSCSSEDEECCIYTYKGDSSQMADLPSSFFRLDFMPSRQHPNSRNSSPDMDYLEMDFDPGPSNDRDSSSGSEFDGAREDEEKMFPAEASSLPVQQPSSIPTPEPAVEPELNSPTPVSPLSTPSPVWNSRPQSSPDRPNSSSK